MEAPFVVERFTGLNLVDSPYLVGPGAAVDLSNVWISHGELQAVPDVSTFATGVDPITRLHTHGTGLHLLASEADGTNNTLQAFDSAGSSVASTTFAVVNAAPWAFASIGTATASRTYVTRPGDTSRRWDGSAWASVAAVPAGAAIALADNATRLAVGGTSANPHRVAFSAPGDPETFGAADIVDIAPGDGESIVAMVTWNNMLFVFKNTKFALFYGVDTDNDGSAIFNYHMIDYGVGVGLKGVLYSGGGACAGPDGVYFVAHSGLYKTTGDKPVLVSKDIQSLWPVLQTPTYTNVPALSLGSYVNLAHSNGNLYLSGTGGGDPITYVLLNDGWTYLTIQENAGNTGPANFADLRGNNVFSLPGSTSIKRLNVTSGPSSAHSWAYQSGYYDLGSAREKSIRFMDLYGSGSVTAAMVAYGQRASAPTDAGSAISLTSGRRGRRSPGVSGRFFAHRLSGSTNNRVERMELTFTESDVR